MKIKDAIARCLYIVRRLKNGQKANFSQIQNHLKAMSELTGEDYSISIRTFQRDVETIQTLFGIEINFDRYNGVYCINEDVTEGIISERMLNSFEVFQSLKLVDNLSPIFHLEPKNILGSEHLLGIIKAIKKCRLITLTYNKNWENNFKTYLVLPLLIKEFRGRWYVVTQEESTKSIKTFSLDRMVSFRIEKNKGVPPNNFQHFFEAAFGIYGSIAPDVEEVILKFSPTAGRYIKEAKLHPSQEILVDNVNELRIKLSLMLSFDLKMEIFSYGDYVEVIAPISLRQEFTKRAKKLALLYEK